MRCSREAIEALVAGLCMAAVLLLLLCGLALTGYYTWVDYR